MSLTSPLRLAGLSAALMGGFSLPPVLADEPATPTQTQAKEDTPKVSLLDAMRDGSVAVAAEGSGDGRMTVTVTNRTQRQLRVVLPPGLIATGATGQLAVWAAWAVWAAVWAVWAAVWAVWAAAWAAMGGGMGGGWAAAWAVAWAVVWAAA